MKRVVVVGGGISGLSAAHAVTHGAPGTEVLVLERDPHVGGKAITLKEQGYTIEAGPTGYLDNEPRVDEVVAAAGLAKLPADQAAARRFLVKGGTMREIHPHPLKFARSGLLSPLGLLRVPLDFVVPGKKDDRDESVWDFARRRIGRQAADRLIAPMMLGVFAGDAKKLSLRAALPRMAEMEAEYGSLFKALIAIKKKKRDASMAGPSGVLTSFPEGLQQLPLALAASGRFAVRTGAAATRVGPRPGGGFTVEAGGEAIVADAVILAGEPWAMAPLVRDASQELARRLDGILCPPVAVVALGYGPAAFERVPRGFGVLIPRGEGYRILGCLWDTFLFPGRSPEKRLLLRAMLGGSVDPEAPSLGDVELVEQVRKDLKRLLGLDMTPLYERVVVWPRAIPQYELGHLDTVAAIEKELARLPGLFMAGNALRGIAFSKAVVQGLDAGAAAAVVPALRAGRVGHSPTPTPRGARQGSTGP